MGKLIINLKPNSALTFKDLTMYTIGLLPYLVMNKEKKECFSGDLNSKDLVIEFEKGATYQMDENPFAIGRACEIHGNGAIIKGVGKIGFVPMHSNITIDNLIFEGHQIGIAVSETFGKTVENVLIKNCIFRKNAQLGASIGCTKSKGTIKNVTFDNCLFEGAEAGFDDDYGGTCMLMICAAQSADGKPLNDCLTSGVNITNCKFTNQFRMAIQFLVSIPAVMMNSDIKKIKKLPISKNNTIEKVTISDCDINHSFDAAINVICGCVGAENSIVRDLVITRTHIVQGIWAIYLTGVETISGYSEKGIVTNVEISDCDIEPYVGGCGETTFGISIQSGRIDYENTTEAVDGEVSNLRFLRNKFHDIDRPIFISGSNILNDSPENIVRNCCCKDVLVEGNEFKDCTDIFTIYGSHHEGRRLDWKIGVPPHEKNWGPLWEDPTIVTAKTDGNYVSNVVIRNNHANGFRYKYKISGIWGLGQGIASNNYVDGVTFENNHYEHGEGHVSLKNFAGDDRVIDGGGNYIKNIKE